MEYIIDISVFSLFQHCECHLRLLLKCPEAINDISRHKSHELMKFKSMLMLLPFGSVLISLTSYPPICLKVNILLICKFIFCVYVFGCTKDKFSTYQLYNNVFGCI